ncbi:MAG: 8-amino-7-oxononanoate synthase [Bacteroidota bacterium]
MSEFLNHKLQLRRKNETYRSLPLKEHLLDFCSNDYLGFARSQQLPQLAQQYVQSFSKAGATGSRLITGNHTFIEQVEQEIAQYHAAEAGLLLNSGYDANLGLLACIADAEDTIISDALVHASIIDGIRLSKAQKRIFRHNDLADLAHHLRLAQGRKFIVVESVYSMDGDLAPLTAIANLALQFDAHLLVDEAHATGVIGPEGKGLVQALGLEKVVLARVITFGKALGVHGAIILGSHSLRDYLINFCRPFIFSTGLPLHSIASIKAAYELLKQSKTERHQLHQNIEHFKNGLRDHPWFDQLIPSDSAIQSLVLPGATLAKDCSQLLEHHGFYAKAIVYPTVAKDSERIRICLHSFNSTQDIDALSDQIKLAESTTRTFG